MKAVVQDRYGSPEDLELRDVEKPRVGDGEVLVRVRAASVHPDVWHVVCGRPYVLRLMGAGLLRPKNPIPGTDMAFSAFWRALQPEGRYVPIGHEGYRTSGRRVFGLIPHFLRLMLLSRFQKQLRGPGTPFPTKREAIDVLRNLLESGKITPIIERPSGT